MRIPIHLTEISTFEWHENEKSVTKPPFGRRVQNAWPYCIFNLLLGYSIHTLTAFRGMVQFVSSMLSQDYTMQGPCIVLKLTQAYKINRQYLLYLQKNHKTN